jgi:hypothetical protein
LNFNPETATLTTDIIGKHLCEFRKNNFNEESKMKNSENSVPEIFVLLVSFFEVQPNLLKTEGLFRVAASVDKIDELQVHISMGNFFYLTLLKQEPHVVANFLKKVLKYMGEPLCTFALYNRFRDLSDTPVDKRCAKLKDICAALPAINRNVFVFIIKFFNKVTK